MSDAQYVLGAPLGAVRERYRLDRSVVAILGLTMGIQCISVLAVLYLDFAGLELPSTPESSPTIGLRMVGMLVVECLVIIGIYRLYNRFPALLKKALQWAFKGAAGVGAVYLGLYAGLFGKVYLGIFAVILVVDELLERYDLDYLLHNSMALVMGVLAASVMGQFLSPSAIIPFLVAMIIWDVAAVDLSDLMGDLISFSGSIGIPNYFIIPKGATVDWGGVKDFVTDMENAEKPSDVSTLIGLGDFIFPALLSVSAAATIGGEGAVLPVLGVLIGTCVAVFELHVAMDARDKGAPALAWLNTGALIGFFIGVLASGVPIMAALGVMGS